MGENALIDQTKRDLGNLQYQIARIKVGELPRFHDGIDTLPDLQRRERDAIAILANYSPNGYQFRLGPLA
jgi:hypothetical protein